MSKKFSDWNDDALFAQICQEILHLSVYERSADYGVFSAYRPTSDLKAQCQDTARRSVRRVEKLLSEFDNLIPA